MIITIMNICTISIASICCVYITIDIIKIRRATKIQKAEAARLLRILAPQKEELRFLQQL